jgi:photosystem II stability/assembly factor-like uncharacterized protein
VSGYALLAAAALALSCSHTVHQLERENAPDAAAAYFAAKRGNVDVVAKWNAAREQLRHQPRVATDATTDTRQWTFLGPGNIGGRTRPLVLDPTNADTIYTGAVSGGVWKTADGGGHWNPTGDEMSNLAVSSLAMSPRDPRTLFAGTGEGYFREDVRGTALPIRGDGIFVTRDGAASWTQLPSTKNDDFHWVNDLAVSTHDANRIYAATRSGVWRSNDEGSTWTRVVSTTVKGGCLDLAFRADTDSDYLFASCGVFEQATVYRTQHGESNDAWTAVLSEPGMSRTSLAIAPSNPSVIYALAARNALGVLDQSLLAVYRSDRSGDPGSWVAQQRADGPLPGSVLLVNPLAATFLQCNQGRNQTVSMGWHCNVITVDPRNENRVWAAGVDVFRSDDGGKSWGLASYWWTDLDAPSYSHADHHAIVFDPHNDNRIFVTNDGGVFRTDNPNDPVATGPTATCRDTNTSVRWTSLNHNYGATQFYHGAVIPDGRTFFGGAQDNGTLFGTVEGGVDGWEMLWGGDGAFVGVDAGNADHVYAESQNGALVHSLDRGRKFSNAAPPCCDEYLFVTPIAVDANKPGRLWIGGSRVLRNDSVSTPPIWAMATQPLDGLVSALAVSPASSSLVLAGTTTGKVYRSETATTDSNATWSFTAPRDGWVASLTFDPTNADVVYATYALFGGTHIFKSTDAGKSWSPLGESLPDLPVHSLAIDPTSPARLFIGTDLGVFVSNDNGGSWQAERGFPQVITETLLIARGSAGPALYAFTHGRGAWRADLTTPARRRPLAR